jgi:hypothetical protein
VQRFVLLFTPSVSALVDDLHRDSETCSCIQECAEDNHLISFKLSNFSGYAICTAGFDASSASCPHFYLHASFDSQNKKLLFSTESSPVGLANSITLFSF